MKFIFRTWVIILFSFTLIGGYAQHKLTEPFDPTLIPPSPDYNSESAWAALPFTKDVADSIPRKSDLSDFQASAKADVFFIHPTILTYKPKGKYKWNGDINDFELNNKVDNSTILNQASVFNGSCRVFAPRYRQAHYSAFTTENPDFKKQSLEIAYTDVRAAFMHYLENWNNNRPIVIASHSQGTIHAGMLIKEFFEGKPLQKNLVVAYLVGIATPKDYFSEIPLSTKRNDVGTWVSWNSFLKGYYPEYYNDGLQAAACINPLTWNDSEDWISHKENSGAVGFGYKFKDQALGAQCHEGMLWIEKPRIFGKIFIRTKIWHFADINLFWNNIRENVALRLETFEASK